VNGEPNWYLCARGSRWGVTGGATIRSDFTELIATEDRARFRVFAGVEGTEKECLWVDVAGIVRKKKRKTRRSSLKMLWSSWLSSSRALKARVKESS
jgi:hypothetical protein